MSELKRINVRIRPQLYEALKIAAKQRGLSMNAMYILALETYLQQLKVTDNLDDLIKAWKERE
jgi:predicted HicB family RNase H-like nuclease